MAFKLKSGNNTKFKGMGSFKKLSYKLKKTKKDTPPTPGEDEKSMYSSKN